MISAELRKALACDIQSPAKKAQSYPKRLHNIKWAHRLPSQGLSYPTKVRAVEVYRTAAGESLQLLYPGKETKRGGDANRPHDFFPLLYRADRSRMEDLRFGRVFAAFQELTKEGSDESGSLMALLAVSVYRMAHMLDHLLSENPELRVMDGTLETAGARLRKGYRSEEFRSFYAYSPHELLRPHLKRAVRSLGVTVEGLLEYCDILAWNEDSKYYYRALKKHREKSGTGEPKWMGATGRVNTLLTGLTVIGFEAGVVEFAELVDRFTSQRGVAPAAKDEIERMTDGMVQASA